MFSASEIWPLTRRTAEAARVHVRPITGVPVARATEPTQRGARRSRDTMIASREGTSIVALTDVVRAITAPSPTNHAAPTGRYTAAASTIGAGLLANFCPGKTPKATVEIRKYATVAIRIPFAKIIGSRRVDSLTSPAVWASDSKPA